MTGGQAAEIRRLVARALVAIRVLGRGAALAPYVKACLA